MSQIEKDDMNWVPYTRAGRHQGADKIVADELELIRKRRSSASSDDLAGLAMSGGGIRSASFGLGVMQGLAEQGLLKRMDYLSTVSGGGYIGSALTWLCSRKWGKKTPAASFDTSPVGFPFQIRFPDNNANPEVTEQQRVRRALMNFLRQHGNYLAPGHGITTLSLIGVILRNSLVSLVLYFGLLTLLLFGLKQAGLFGNAADYCSTLFGKLPQDTPLAWGLALAGLIVIALSSFAYALFTFFFSRSLRRTPGVSTYALRRLYERVIPWLLLAIGALLLLGSLPVVYHFLQAPKPLSADASLYELLRHWAAAITGTISTLLGVVGTLRSFFKSHAGKDSKSNGAVIIIAAVLMLYGGLLAGYQLAAEWSGGWPATFAALAILLVFGLLTNINYLSVHRYYRDRLMETFMPDECVIQPGGKTPTASPEADKARLHDMADATASGHGPYHIINTNVILTRSKLHKFRGRGGDNFILSPLYSGSNATGWHSTRDFMKGGMTLATAMAISGAAVNPGAGCGGTGPTRNALVSILMNALNVRLGYWVPNPNPRRQPLGTANMIWPGLTGVMLNGLMNERGRWLQLSDGGHFENLGLYELVRRRCKLIIVSDAGADPGFEFTDLAIAMERVLADFGARIRLSSRELTALVPDNDETGPRFRPGYARSGFLMADIHYGGGGSGKLVYIKTSFVPELSADLHGYKASHPEFPDEPTSDQFFNEEQLEAYRRLGRQLAMAMANNSELRGDEAVRNILFSG